MTIGTACLAPIDCVRFVDPLLPGSAAVLAVTVCHDGFWGVTDALLAECCRIACRSGLLVSLAPAEADGRPSGKALASVVFQSGDDIACYAPTAWGRSAPAIHRLSCTVGARPLARHGFTAQAWADDWRAALGLVRLLVPASGPLRVDPQDILLDLGDTIVRCEIGRLGEALPLPAHEAAMLHLSFSERLRVEEVVEHVRLWSDTLPAGVDMSYSTGHATLMTHEVDVIAAFQGDAPYSTTG